MTTSTSSFQVIPITKLALSRTNPRQHFDAKGLEELTASVKAKGVLVPLLVRPAPSKAEGPANHNGCFEIVAGARRFRAAQAAALTELPCLVRTLSDLEVLEAQVIENLQREDVHPLDEAQGYQTLMQRHKYDVARIAERVGRSVKYVYDRVKLLGLTKEAKELFWAGTITAGHAILLARLPADDQERCMQQGGLFRVENTLYHEDEDEKDEYVTVGVRELDDWIKRHVRFDHKQPDPMLFPETAEAVTEAAEEKRKVVEITDEYLASDDVRRASATRVYGERAWKRADGREGSKPCDYAVLGVFAAGGHRGEAFDVCLRKDKCLVHWGKDIKARANRTKGEPSVDRYREQEQKQEEKRRQEHERHEAAQQRWKKATPAILEAVAERVKKMPTKATGRLADYIVQDVQEYSMTSHKAAGYVPRGKSADDLIRHAAFMVLAKTVQDWCAAEDFPKQAKALGVDLAKILNEAAPEEKPKPESKPVQTSALEPRKKRKVA